MHKAEDFQNNLNKLGSLFKDFEIKQSRFARNIPATVAIDYPGLAFVLYLKDFYLALLKQDSYYWHFLYSC